MKALFAHKTIVLGEFEFTGFRFSEYENYPWNNLKERKAFYDNLIKERSEENKVKAVEMLKKEMMEKMHITISYAYAFLFTSILILSFAVAFTFTSYRTLGFVWIGWSLYGIFQHLRHNHKAKQIAAGFQFNSYLLTLEFDEKFAKATEEVKRVNEEYKKYATEKLSEIAKEQK